jgi:hypothetical protein
MEISCQEIPTEGSSVLVSIRDRNSYYKEVMIFKIDEKQWYYQSGSLLKDGLRVGGWKETGSTFLG